MAPTFALVVPTLAASVEQLHATIASLQAQHHLDWELLLVDDPANDDDVRALLVVAPNVDDRVRRVPSAHPDDPPGHGLASGAAGAAAGLAAAAAPFVTFLDPGDVLHPDALAAVNHAVVHIDRVDVAYTDEKGLTKPDWSPELLRSRPYLGRLTVLRGSLVESVGGVRVEFGAAHEHDLLLRVTERTDRIVHLAQALCHRGTPAPADEPGAAGRRAVQEHCERVGIPAVVEVLPDGAGYRVRRTAVVRPLVSVVVAVPDVDAAATVARAVSALARPEATPQPVEVIVVLGESVPESVAVELTTELGAGEGGEGGEGGGEAEGGAGTRRVLRVGDAASASDLVNAGAAVSAGEVLVLLDADVELLTADWADTMLGLAVERTAGVVALRPGGIVDAECSEVHPGCLVLRRRVWDELGGLPPGVAPGPSATALADKARLRGYRVIGAAHVDVARLPPPGKPTNSDS